jgi:UDP-GlcNAc:undecaprenyl-phosphate GlcNAc-1-phosphate transferase
MVLIGSILDLIVIAAAGRWLLPHVQRFLEGHRQVETNYAGQVIPRGLGALLWLLLWLQELILRVTEWVIEQMQIDSLTMIEWVATNSNHLVFTFAATLIFLLGWTDDLIGSKAVKGLKGHYRYWQETRTFSMGAVKVLGIATAAGWLVLSVRSEQTPIWWIGGQMVLLMLMTNALNLLDVRPGRSLKFFFTGVVTVMLVCIMIAGDSILKLFPIWPVCLGGYWVYRMDVRGRGMLGDAGANLLGFTLGYTVIMTLPWQLQCLIAIILILLHKQAEVSSITALIERNRFLNWLDRLGRT